MNRSVGMCLTVFAAILLLAFPAPGQAAAKPTWWVSGAVVKISKVRAAYKITTHVFISAQNGSVLKGLAERGVEVSQEGDEAAKVHKLISFTDDAKFVLFDVAKAEGKEAAVRRALSTKFRPKGTATWLNISDYINARTEDQWYSQKCTKCSAATLRIGHCPICKAKVKVRMSADGKILGPVRAHDSFIGGLAISPKGLCLATSGGYGTVCFWSTETGRKLGDSQRPKDTDRIKSLRFTDPQSLLVHTERAIRVVTVPSGKVTRTITLPEGRTFSRAAFSPDGANVISGDGNHKDAILLSIKTGKHTVIPVGGYPCAMAFSPDGSYVAVAGGHYTQGKSQTVQVWAIANGKEYAAIDVGKKAADVVRFSPNGRLLAIGGGDSSVRLWSVPDRKISRLCKGHQYRVEQLAFSPDGRVLASSDCKDIRLWGVDGDGDRTLTEAYGRRLLVFSANGRYLAHSGGGEVYLTPTGDWTPKPITPSGSEMAFCEAVFSPDSATLVTGHMKGQVRLWNPATFKQKVELCAD